jgi:AcrR family transcriptional regulator
LRLVKRPAIFRAMASRPSDVDHTVEPADGDEQCGAPGYPCSPYPRRRSARARQAILDAANALLDEHGFARTTIEAIAARAGVGKQTIYRWWPCRASVLLEAYLARGDRQVPVPDTGVLRADLTGYLARLVEVLTCSVAGQTIAGVAAQAQSDPDLACVFREQFVDVRRGEIRAILARGAERGELRPDVDLELATDALFGPVWARLLLTHAPLDRAVAATLVDALLCGFGARASAPAPDRNLPVAPTP